MAQNKKTNPFDQARNLLSQVGSSVGSYFNPTSNAGNNFWGQMGQVQQKLPQVANTAVNAFKQNQTLSPWRQQLPNVPKVNLPNINTSGKLVNLGYNNLIRPMAEDIINTPHNLIGGSNLINKSINTKDVRGLLSGVGQAGGAALNLATLGTGTVAKSLVKPTIKQAIIHGGKVGATLGGAYGLTGGLQSGQNITNDNEYLVNLLKSIGMGAAAGGALGGLAGGAGGMVGTIKRLTTRSPEVEKQLLQRRSPNGQWMAEVKLVKPKGMSNDQWSFQVRFNKKYNRDGYTPVYPSDVQDAIKYESSKRGVGMSIRDINKDINPLSAKPSVLTGKQPQPEVLGQGLLKQPVYPPGTEANLATNPDLTKTNPYSTQDYIKELTQKQQQAGSSGNVGFKQKVGSFLADVKAKMVDETAPIEDVLSAAEKKNKFKVLPKEDIRLQIDRVLRSKTLASQFAEDNGLVNVIKKVPDLDALDQYMIAKQAATIEKVGFKSGRDLVKDQQLIQDLAPQYEPFAQQVNQYSRKLLDYSVKSGLIDQKLANELIKKYPEYVPLQRIFSELEQPSFKGTGKGVASLSKQTVVKKLEGSEREIASPIESLLLKTQDAFSQGERNVAGKQLAGYRKLPGFEGLITEVDAGAKSPHTFSFIDNGVKRTFATTPDIEAAAKSLNVEQMGFLGKIISVPTRALQLGATGLNIPFVVTNLLKDEVTGFVNANRAAKVSLLNPANYIKSLLSAVKHDELYKDVIRSAGGGTSFDIAREAPNLAVQKIRNPGGYTVRHPLELLRAVENIIGRSEELGRIKNFAGTREALLKEGRTAQDATLLAAKAARENTANFARRGSFGRVINWMVPFFNAGIQGARQLTRSFQNAPAQTATKVAATIFTPIAVATVWNLSDPQRKQIYQDIPSYEKENNIILIPPDPTQDARGRWNVIKFPLPPGLSNLGTIVRRSLETTQGLNPITFGEIATNLITTGSSVDVTSGNKLASTFTPQIVKPVVEATTNTNLFTGQKIVPDYLKSQPPELQTKAGVSPVATGIGKALNVSPLMVENFAQTQLGGLGSQLLGKESVGGNIERRFRKASGGDLLDKVYNDSIKIQSIESQAKKLISVGKKEEALSLIQSNKDLLAKSSQVKTIKSQVDKLQEMKNKVKEDSNLSQKQKDKVLKVISQKLYELSSVYSQLEKGGQ